VNFSSLDPGVLKKKILKCFFFSNVTIYKISPIVAPSYPGGHAFIKHAFVLFQNAYMLNSVALVHWFFKRIIEYVSYINTCKNSSPGVVPH
jgi:hypothetical protein